MRLSEKANQEAKLKKRGISEFFGSRGLDAELSQKDE